MFQSWSNKDHVTEQTAHSQAEMDGQASGRRAELNKLMADK